MLIGLPEIALVLLFLSCAWLVWETLKSREAANAAMREACDARGYLFLDDTVSLRSVRPVRNDAGHIRLRRVYDFQYSDTGHNRRDGTITLIAGSVVTLEMNAGSPRELAP